MAWTISGAQQLGRTVLNISRSVPAPLTRLAVTYSLESSVITEARVSRVNCGR